ncbi:MAG: spore photoproduct lyase [Bacillota bacterium]
MFVPKRVFFERDALRYPLGERLYHRFKSSGLPLSYTTGHNRVTGVPGDTPRRAYAEAKATLVVGVKRSLEFQGSRPSADYALPLVTGCPGHCQYCYLQTTLGPRPYIRVYVNVDEILARAGRYIKERLPKETSFEGSCTSDPVPVEPYTGSLASAVRFFAGQEKGRFRFVTKDPQVSGLLGVEHGGHTEARVSLSPRYVEETFEAGVAPTSERVRAARQLWKAGYAVGFLVAPVMVYPGWKEELEDLLRQVAKAAEWAPFLEVVTHRFTARAKRLILARHPGTLLPLEEEGRQYRFGQFGYGKYVYPPKVLEDIRAFLQEETQRILPGSQVRYVV